MQDSPALVLNADFRPLSYFPLSLWSWQEAVKAVYRNGVLTVTLPKVAQPGPEVRTIPVTTS